MADVRLVKSFFIKKKNCKRARRKCPYVIRPKIKSVPLLKSVEYRKSTDYQNMKRSN